MSMTSGKFVWLCAAGLLALTLGVAGCKSSGGRTTGQKWHDRQVAKAVDKKLAADPTYKFNDVQANVYESTVQLTGFVETPEQRQRAADLAAQARGASQVVNEILIKPVPTGPATIRDPFGREGGRLMLNTNAPSPGAGNAPESQAVPQSQAPGAGTTQEGTSQQP